MHYSRPFLAFILVVFKQTFTSQKLLTQTRIVGEEGEPADRSTTTMALGKSENKNHFISINLLGGKDPFLEEFDFSDWLKTRRHFSHNCHPI